MLGGDMDGFHGTDTPGLGCWYVSAWLVGFGWSECVYMCERRVGERGVESQEEKAEEIGREEKKERERRKWEKTRRENDIHIYHLRDH